MPQNDRKFSIKSRKLINTFGQINEEQTEPNRCCTVIIPKPLLASLIHSRIEWVSFFIFIPSAKSFQTNQVFVTFQLHCCCPSNGTPIFFRGQRQDWVFILYEIPRVLFPSGDGIRQRKYPQSIFSIITCRNCSFIHWKRAKQIPAKRDTPRVALFLSTKEQIFLSNL